MKKVQLEIAGLSYSQTQSGAYVLLLSESGGKRRLPIVIGGFEAQAIAIELEKLAPSRPLTHDLFKSFAESFSVQVTEVIIFDLIEGIFHAKLVCRNFEKELEIDARTSDAIAIAVRFDCPIYTYEFILESSGVALDEGIQSLNKEVEESDENLDFIPEEENMGFSDKSTEELKTMLHNALEEEQYEMASKLRDELNQRKKS